MRFLSLPFHNALKPSDAGARASTRASAIFLSDSIDLELFVRKVLALVVFVAICEVVVAAITSNL